MRIPLSTYRLQFNRNFRYQDAQAIVPYLHRLGISHIYASPAFQARIGSEHGYDVADPTRINAEVGTRADFDRLVRALHSHRMDLLLDIVPNHMAASVENPWWNDVLENGRKSRYAHFFDIDWDGSEENTAGKKISGQGIAHSVRVLMPLLGEPYELAINHGELHLRFDQRGFFIDYRGLRIPLAPETYAGILNLCLSELPASLQAKLSSTISRSIVRPISELATHPPGLKTALRESIITRTKRALWHLHQSSRVFRAALKHVLNKFEVNVKKPSSGAAHLLHALLSQQHYRIVFWRLAVEEINYRRFFHINDLVSLRVELPDVFHARHAYIAQLIRQGAIGALRVDHVDGLRDPFEYLRRANAELRRHPSDRKKNDGVYTIVEKITCGDETLPVEWPVQGTTGYDFLNALNFLFTSGPGYQQLEKLHSKLTGDTHSFESVWRERKLMVIDQLFRPEIRSLTDRLAALASADPRARSICRDSLAQALKEFTAALPIYRTYIRSNSSPSISPADRRILLHTLRLASPPASAPRLPPKPLSPLLPPPLHRAPSLFLTLLTPDPSRISPPLATFHRPRHGQRLRGHHLLYPHPPHLSERRDR